MDGLLTAPATCWIQKRGRTGGTLTLYRDRLVWQAKIGPLWPLTTLEVPSVEIPFQAIDKLTSRRQGLAHGMKISSGGVEYLFTLGEWPIPFSTKRVVEKWMRAIEELRGQAIT